MTRITHKKHQRDNKETQIYKWMQINSEKMQMNKKKPKWFRLFWDGFFCLFVFVKLIVGAFPYLCSGTITNLVSLTLHYRPLRKPESNLEKKSMASANLCLFLSRDRAAFCPINCLHSGILPITGSNTHHQTVIK